jgi:branched-chain amino acid transport system permease protein
LALADFLQFLIAGLTIGAIYALIGLGFSLIYNACDVINFAQGEFLMIGGLTTAVLTASGMPLPLAAVIAIAGAAAAGLLVERLAVETARNASVITLIIITIGASILLRGIAQVIFGKNFHSLPSFSGDAPIRIGGAAIAPQALWVMGVSVVLLVALHWFFTRTLTGKALIATSHNRLAADLVGIDTKRILRLSFVVSAVLGAIAGLLIAPISLAKFDAGVLLGLKGFSAAILGGLSSVMGAVAGGLILGLIEALCAGYVSSAYKDAIAFVILLLVLFVRPQGLFGRPLSSRV